jgi:ribosomal protein S18 acetylase RimI-like enzyme
VCGVRLYVETENAGAQATYEALGMQPAHYRKYELEFPPPGKSEGSQASH